MNTPGQPGRYRAAIIGLSGIAANRQGMESHPALGNVQVGSHAAAYQLVPETEVVAICELRTELFDTFRSTWDDI